MSWNPVDGGKEIASGVAPRELIRFADIGELVSWLARKHTRAHDW